MAEALRHREQLGQLRKSQCEMFNKETGINMRKLQRFVLNQNLPLSASEMSDISGGDSVFISEYCYHVNDKCCVKVPGGSVIGTCEWKTSDSEKLECRTS